MKNNTDKEPKLYSTKSKVLIAVAIAAVVAVTAVCIIFISRSFNKPAETETSDVPAGFKPVDTSVVTDGTEPAPQTDTDAAPDTGESSDTEKDTVTDATTDTDTETVTGGTETTADEPVNTAGTDALPEPEKEGTKLTNGVVLVKLEKYSGPFVEDGSDAPVENIISAVVKNTGDTAVQLLEFSVETDAGEAQFFATTLLPHTTTKILERNKMVFPEGKIGIAKLTQIGNFIEEPSFCFDVFDINGADGSFIITNKSEDDITGKVTVYYKTVKDGMYFGGITYSATAQGGIRAGDSMLLGANHFRIDDSRLMFVKYD